MTCLWLISSPASSAPTAEAVLQKARNHFYDAVQKEESIELAIQSFRDLAMRDPRLEGRAETYIGSLTAMKAKYSFWPHDKVAYAKDGLKIMDKGLKKAGDDIEALFIHGSTCYYLPFFFGRSDDAQRSFSRIVELLPSQADDFDKALMKNVVGFLLENAELAEGQKAMLTQKLASLQ